MIPVHLQILGLLSYLDPVDFEFTGFIMDDLFMNKIPFCKYETPKAKE